MARGRGGASQGGALVAVALALACCCCCIAGRGVSAATYYVGDDNGWSLSSPSWPNGKRFHAGDVLVFRYLPWIHNVVAVEADGCATPAGSRTYTSGNDSVTLARGVNRFICTRYGHCYLGMRMVVNAA